MKKLLLFFLFSFPSLAYAQSYDYITLRQTDGTEVSFSTEGLKMQFRNGNLLAYSKADAEKSFPLATMDFMFFSDTATAIERVNADAPRIVNGKLTGAAADAKVFAIDGKPANRNRLAAGAYLVRTQGVTYKVLAK